jgi:uncharacterized protein YndB with AHSA1/START domain
MTGSPAATSRRSFTLTRSIDSPRDEVFRAWTDPERLGWFYNSDQPTPDEPIELDLRVGGAWRQMMVIDADTQYVTGGVYREIVPNERLVFAWGAEGGWPRLDPDDLDAAPQVTVTFEARAGRTDLTLRVELPAAMPDDGVPGWWRYAEHGWADTIGRLPEAPPTAPDRP